MNLHQSKHHLFVHIQQYKFAKCTNQTISACTLYITKLANSPNRASSPRISLLFCEQNLRITLTFTAFPYTISIFAGFWFLGLAYGIYMNVFDFRYV